MHSVLMVGMLLHNTGAASDAMSKRSQMCWFLTLFTLYVWSRRCRLSLTLDTQRQVSHTRAKHNMSQIILLLNFWQAAMYRCIYLIWEIQVVCPSFVSMPAHVAVHPQPWLRHTYAYSFHMRTMVLMQAWASSSLNATCWQALSIALTYSVQWLHHIACRLRHFILAACDSTLVRAVYVGKNLQQHLRVHCSMATSTIWVKILGQPVGRVQRYSLFLYLLPFVLKGALRYVSHQAKCKSHTNLYV